MTVEKYFVGLGKQEQYELCSCIEKKLKSKTLQGLIQFCGFSASRIGVAKELADRRQRPQKSWCQSSGRTLIDQGQ